MAPILINRAPWNALIDDSGQNLDGTPWTKDKIKTVLLDPIDVALADVDDGTTKDASQDTAIANNTTAINAKLGVTTTADAPTGTVHNFALTGITKDTLWNWQGTADLILSGVAGGVQGARLIIKNFSAKNIYLVNYTVSASAAVNQFYNILTSGPTPIGPYGWATYIHTGGGWVLVDHNQGTPITAPFSAANFLAAGGPWTVAAGQIALCSYVVSGKLLTLMLTITGSNIAATASSLAVMTAAFGGYTLNPSTPAIPQLGYMATWVSLLTQYQADRVLIYQVTGSFPAGGFNLYLSPQIPIT